jgi:protein subunit release factor B
MGLGWREIYKREMRRPDTILNKNKTLIEKMSGLGIREQDIVESFVKSKGPGGQNVNKTSTAVYLKHIPTGIEVKCQKERSQLLNRCIARKILLRKIETLVLKNLSEERQRTEKIRRQERTRSKKAKLKILEAKRRHAQKKLLRAKIRHVE